MPEPPSATCTLTALRSRLPIHWDSYTIGSVASAATTLDPNGVFFHNTMDSLNYFMRERGLPAEMRHALREYFTMHCWFMLALPCWRRSPCHL